MMGFWTVVTFLVEHIVLLFWLTVVAAAFVIGGVRAGFAFSTLGLSHLAYRHGQKKTEAEIKEAIKRIEQKRKAAYEEIDARKSDGDSVLKRLHEGSY